MTSSRMPQAATLLRTHAAGILIALAVGFVTALPPLVAEMRMGDAYQGIRPLVIDDQIYYQVRAHETLDGHPTLGNPYLFEHKQAAAVQFWIPDMVLATVGQWLGGLSAGSILWSFLFPFLISLFSYAILFLVSRDRLLSAGLTVLLDPGIAYAPFLRSPHPQLFCLLLLALLATLLALRTRRAAWIALSILVGGASFYVYPFYWTYWVVTLAGAIVLMFLFVRSTKAHLKLLGIFGATLALSIPYFLESYRASKVPFYLESLKRIGVIETHLPSGFLIVAIAFAATILALYAWKKNLVPRTPETVLVIASCLAGAVVTNQHVVTGMNFFFTVHYSLFAKFMTIFVVGACLPGLLARFVPPQHELRARQALVALLVAIPLVIGVPAMLRIATPKESDILAERYAPVLAWLDGHTKTDDVIYADGLLSSYIPAYTRDNVFFAAYAQQSFISQKEVDERYLGAHYFDGLTRESILDTESDVFGSYYVGRRQHAATVNRLRTLLGIPPEEVEAYPEEAIVDLVRREALLRKGDWYAAVRGYRVDYLVIDTRRDLGWKAPRGASETYEAEGIVVYALPERP